MPFLREFIFSIVEEWKGWITGSLPMAIIAALALLKPDIAPLPIWQWLLLIFAAGLSCAVYRVYKRARIAQLAAEQRLSAIAQDRPLTFVTMNLHASQPDGRHNLWAIKRIELVFENLSDRMLEYAVSQLDVEINGATTSLDSSVDRGGYIHARQQQLYGFDISHQGMSPTPLTIVFRFVVDYDNVPKLLKRTSERKIRYVYSSFKPVAWSNIVLAQDER